MSKKSVTLKDVAASADVSVGMASRVLGKYGSYSEETRVRVESAAHTLGYRANGVARSLRLRRTKTVGVLINQITSYHWTNFVRGVEEAAYQAGYHVIICNTNDDPKREIAQLSEMHERGVDGIIASPLLANRRKFKDMVSTILPAVFVNSRLAGGNLVHISSDDRSAACDAVLHLGAAGHRRIGIVAGPQVFETGQARLGGYRDGLDQVGIELDQELIAYGDFRQAGGYAATRVLVELKSPPTAILVCSELMTGGALRCLKDLGVSIPGDMSLVGFDDPEWASFYNPAVTCLREERFYMGRLAFEALVAGIESQPSPVGETRELVLKFELMRRESVAAPRDPARVLKLAQPPADGRPNTGSSDENRKD